MGGTAAERCIIFAEDDDLFRRAAREVLEQSHLAGEVVACRDGVEFMAALVERLTRSGGVALAVLDIMMPHLDGISAARALRGLERGLGRKAPIPILFLTAVPPNETLRAAVEECAPARYLQKASNTLRGVLVETVRELIEGARS
ncbi:MAG: response regulator [candidate division NC10 bacterium]|nr:response regulator [candidate division NC10 bacterium]MBI3002896.1 response regulator [candidate division NC10 bacterium]